MGDLLQTTAGVLVDTKEIMVCIDSKGLVTKANCLIEASYTLTLNEQRIILACVAKLDACKPMPRDAVFTPTANEFCNLIGTDPTSTYPELREAVNRLFEREIDH